MADPLKFSRIEKLPNPVFLKVAKITFAGIFSLAVKGVLRKNKVDEILHITKKKWIFYLQ